MPQTDSLPDIYFTVPVKADSLHTSAYRTVHVVVLNQKHASTTEIILKPLLFVFIMSASLFFILYKIKPGKRLNNLLNTGEKVSEIIDSRIEKGEL